MSEYRMISVWFGMIAALLAIGCNAANEDVGEQIRVPAGKADQHECSTYFWNTTLLATTSELRNKLDELREMHPQRLTVKDQYLLNRGITTAATASLCDNIAACNVDTSGAHLFFDWIKQIHVVGPNVPSDPQIHNDRMSKVPVCVGGGCGINTLGALLNQEKRRIEGLLARDWANAFSASTRAAGQMDTYSGNTVVVAISKELVSTTYDVIRGLTGKYAYLSDYYQCSDVNDTSVLCQPRTQIGDIRLVDAYGDAYYTVFNLYVFTAKIFDTDDFEVLPIPEADVKSLNVKVWSDATCPTSSTFKIPQNHKADLKLGDDFQLTTTSTGVAFAPVTVPSTTVANVTEGIGLATVMKEIGGQKTVVPATAVPACF